jgi:hypothetical protein
MTSAVKSNYLLSEQSIGMPLERGRVAYPINFFMKDGYHKRAGL